MSNNSKKGGHTQPLGHPPVYMLSVTLTQNGGKGILFEKIIFRKTD
jgi:hypothetical protein